MRWCYTSSLCMAGGNSMFSTQSDERRTLILMQMRGAPHMDPSSTRLALLLSFLLKALYLCLREYYITLSLSSTIIYITLTHEDINNWLPLVLASVALFVDTARLLKGALVLWFFGLGSVLWGICWDQDDPLGAMSTPPVSKAHFFSGEGSCRLVRYNMEQQ